MGTDQIRCERHPEYLVVARSQTGKEAVDRLWSESIGVAYAAVKPVSGDPLEALPIEAKPHVHAAIMRRLMAIDSPKKHNLEQWIQLGKQALLHRQNGNPQRDQQGRFLAVADLWEDDASGKPQIAYMATSKRTWSAEEDIDLGICALETAAWHPPDHLELRQEGSKHSHPLVQWTAKRLLKKIDQ